jgi:hypothetical protein
MRGLSQKYDVCRTLIPIWVDKYERGEFDDDAVEEELLPEYQARIAALERLVGRQALEIELSQRGLVGENDRREVGLGP